MTEHHTARAVSNEEHRKVGFGISDVKGREIGAILRTSVVTHTELSEEERKYRSSWRKAPGVYFGFEPHATRNGVAYGASQSLALFATEAERDAAITKYLANARKRAAKREGK